MTLHFGRKFWRFLTTVVVLFMLFVVGRNLVLAVKIKGFPKNSLRNFYPAIPR